MVMTFASYHYLCALSHSNWKFPSTVPAGWFPFDTPMMHQCSKALRAQRKAETLTIRALLGFWQATDRRHMRSLNGLGCAVNFVHSDILNK